MKRQFLKNIYYFGNDLCQRYFDSVPEKLMKLADRIEDDYYHEHGLVKVGGRIKWIFTAFSACMTALPMLPMLPMELGLRKLIGKYLHDSNSRKDFINVPLLLSDGTEAEIDVCCAMCAEITPEEFEDLKSTESPIQLHTQKLNWSEVKKELRGKE